MIREKSCGAVIVKDDKVLLERQENFFWSFPKGHVEGNENEIETAKREVLEETNIKINIDETKRFTLSYIIPDLNIDKEVVLFLATVKDDSNLRKQDSEILELRWVPIVEVQNYFPRKAWTDVWMQIKKELEK